MIPYQIEKIENAILFFAKEHHKKTKKQLSQTFLYKYLAFLDFTSIKETGQPVLNLTYLAFERGPVPKEIYDNRKNYSSPSFKFMESVDNKIQIIPKQNSKPDLDYFSPYELKLMNKLIEIYASSYLDTNMISDCSHKEILAWKRTYEKNKNGVIDFSLTFIDDVYKKDEELLTVQKETFKTYEAIAKT
jgi:uncharacterized phage-associated protein